MSPPDAKLERLDAQLASHARDEAVLRLHLGQALEVIGRGAVFDLGFSSLAVYAVERCERSARWAEGARCLARRVERLPELRSALVTGRVSWSMGELLARVAEPADEARWLDAARGRTVRQMRVLMAEAERASRGAEVARSDASARDGADCAAALEEATGFTASAGETRWVGGDEADDPCTLVCTLDREEAWLFEATRSLLVQLGMHDAEAQAEALLAEAQSTLLAALPEEAFELGRWHSAHVAQQRWSAELRRWRDEAEERCESNIRRSVVAEAVAEAAGAVAERAPDESGVTSGAWAMAAARGTSSLEEESSTLLDRRVRALHEALARHELELSERVLQFHRADGWRQLGYATETQYARERLGMSRSSFLARRSLALRLEALPLVGAALGAGQIGVEAALQIVRVATSSTQAAWVAHARKRTIKHLREEVAAALTALRWSGESDCSPPEEADMEVFHGLERAVVGAGRDDIREQDSRGQAIREQAIREQASEAPVDTGRSTNDAREASDPVAPASDQRRAWRVMLGSLAAWLAAGGVRMSALGTTPVAARASTSAGRVTLRLRVSRATRAWWRELEALASRWLPPTISWPRFLCSCMWRAWRHLSDSGVAYAHIYVRDRYRCSSPVCNRRDVTPHHLKFRSAGGGDEAENVASVCTWCHLYGVHGGRIRASGTADHIHWELGAMKPPCLVVHGRDRVAA